MPDGEDSAESEDKTHHHHHTDDPWCDWCDGQFEEGDEAVALIWDFETTSIIVTFCSDECATEWDCSKSRKERREVILHV